MARDRLYLYDTTLRDGAQTQGVQFSAKEKHQIAAVLDGLGLDYIEGGWPGANPTDTEFFASPPVTRARFTAFGMTKRQGRSADNDDVLAAVLNAGTGAVCLVGKAHDFHVTTALGIGLDDNVANIRDSFAHLATLGARRCLMPNISLTATRPIRPMRCRWSTRPMPLARAGSCSATPTAAPCPTISRAS